MVGKLWFKHHRKGHGTIVFPLICACHPKLTRRLIPPRTDTD
jgi:hypothetical protein